MTMFTQPYKVPVGGIRRVAIDMVIGEGPGYSLETFTSFANLDRANIDDLFFQHPNYAVTDGAAFAHVYYRYQTASTKLATTFFCPAFSNSTVSLFPSISLIAP